MKMDQSARKKEQTYLLQANSVYSETKENWKNRQKSSSQPYHKHVSSVNSKTYTYCIPFWLMLILNFIWDNKTSRGTGAFLLRFSTPKTLISVYSRFKLLRDKGIIWKSFGTGTEYINCNFLLNRFIVAFTFSYCIFPYKVAYTFSFDAKHSYSNERFILMTIKLFLLCIYAEVN